MTNRKSLAPIDQQAVNELISQNNIIDSLDKQIAKLMKQVIPKRRRFCREFTIDWNATQAAIRAGYSARSAYGTANIIMSDSIIQAIVQLFDEKHQLTTGISASWKRRKLKEIVQMTMAEGDTFQPGTAVKAINELSLMDGSHKPKQHHVTSESVSVQLNYQIDIPVRENKETSIIEHDDNDD